MSGKNSNGPRVPLAKVFWFFFSKKNYFLLHAKQSLPVWLAHGPLEPGQVCKTKLHDVGGSV
jgi:hypothetical protein